MEKRTNIFIQFLHAFYQFRAYPGFLRAKAGQSVLFVLLMVVITYIFSFIIPMMDVLPYVNNLDADLVDEYVPNFNISDGKFYIESEFVYEDPNGVMLFVAVSDFDVTMAEAQDVLPEYQQAIIFSSDTIIIKMADGTVNAYPMSAMPDFNREDLYDLIPLVKVIVVIMYFIVFVCYIIAFLFGTLVCSLIGTAVNAFVKAPVTFGQVFKLTIYARTAPVIIKTVMAFLVGGWSMGFILFYGLFIVYILMALRAVKAEHDADSGDANDYVSDMQDIPTPYDDNPNAN